MPDIKMITRRRSGDQPVVQPKYDRQTVMQRACEQLKLGRSLDSICKEPGMPHAATIFDWIRDDPDGIGKDYARAREIGYNFLADEIIALSDKTHELVTVQMRDSAGNLVFENDGTPRVQQVLQPLSADLIAHKRVQIDTRKWMLSKMLPKVYGDKVTQEHTGAGGGPIAIAAVDLRNLSDTELENMNLLMSKASGTP